MLTDEDIKFARHSGCTIIDTNEVFSPSFLCSLFLLLLVKSVVCELTQFTGGEAEGFKEDNILYAPLYKTTLQQCLVGQLES